MSNERINLTQTEKEAAEAFRKGWHADPHRVPRVPLINYQRELIEELIAELKRCYEELDSLPTRWQMSEMFDYTKWLELVESYFLADGSFNQDADFVRKCAVNNKYGYRIEVIDGVETVVHESEY